MVKSSSKKPRATGVPEGGSQPYLVLARKYRPQTFDDLIGQAAMVTTLRNAFEANRIAQAYMLTGVRGVGKTTTARILARALNYVTAGQADARPTVDMPALGEHCLEIMEGRHPDVMEMDAASNTGVDNIREIIESARYKPLVARYKVYIIDEVHMLSKGAFNALLKTLEEPPPHVKFVFATTEVRKVPVTVLSRCQRFDLRRVESPVLIEHLAAIAGKEGTDAEREALALIARAAEGSVRDGLSLLDQAIAMGAGGVTASGVAAMLGLADRGRIFDLLEVLLAGNVAQALESFHALHHDGAEPMQVLTDLSEAVHITARTKAVGVEAAGELLSSDERERAGALAGRVSQALLARAWQMLLKGLEESARAPNQLAAAEMVLIRLAYTADLPSPDEIIRALGGAPVSRGAAGQSRPDAPPRQSPLLVHDAPPLAGRYAGGAAARAAAPEAVDAVPRSDGAPEGKPGLPQSFEAVAELVAREKDAHLLYHLEENVTLVRFEPGRMEIHLLEAAPADLPGKLADRLGKWTGTRWVVAVSNAEGAMPLAEQRRQREASEIEELKRHPAVQALLAEFPEAEIRGIRPIDGAAADDATHDE
ncbi:MAG: DNA polymerase III subunit gamma/tau [Hyphomicrobiaceae bacterium]